jgi:hypothetical protein
MNPVLAFCAALSIALAIFVGLNGMPLFMIFMLAVGLLGFILAARRSK